MGQLVVSDRVNCHRRRRCGVSIHPLRPLRTRARRCYLRPMWWREVQDRSRPQSAPGCAARAPLSPSGRPDVATTHSHQAASPPVPPALSAVRSCSTRSGACRPPSLTVVVTNRRRLTPARPACVTIAPPACVQYEYLWPQARHERAARRRCRARPHAPLGSPRSARRRSRTAATAAASPMHIALHQQPAHRGNRIIRLVITHEPEPFAGIAFVSRANQAAAFERISRSSRSWRFSRRSQLDPRVPPSSGRHCRDPCCVHFAPPSS